MRVTSINKGAQSRLKQGSETIVTGIFKKPMQARVVVTALGLAGDVVCDSNHHGGPDQAVYVYFQEDYDWWFEKTGEVWEAGTFGENLTISSQKPLEICIGDTLKFPDLELQASAPRIPCMTLSARMKIPGFIKQFFDSERPGFYCRVTRAGSIQSGEVCELEHYPGERISIRQFFEDARNKLSARSIERYLSVPIDMRSRKAFETKLAKL